MAKKQMMWKTKGMNRDLSVSAFNPEFSFMNKNLRLSTNEGNTTMSWVNERGPKEIEIEGTDGNALDGTPIGAAVLNEYLVLFTTTGRKDYIYRLNYKGDKMEMTTLYGDKKNQTPLGFKVEHPIETLVSYEAEHIQKVYWTDGINQPRIINIAPSNDTKIAEYTSTSFDFITELQLNEEVKVLKQLGGGGAFAPGVVQYAFTYYNKYGQESNIFYTTPLMYISYRDRGAAPDDKVDNTFKITVKDVDTHFDFLRIYSIQRTSINATPICKRVQDIDIQDLIASKQSGGSEDALVSVSYTDTGYNGNTIDPTELLYKGGEEILAGTIEQKDNTMFFGNIQLKRQDLKKLWEGWKKETKKDITFENDAWRYIKPLSVFEKEPYRYRCQLNSEETILSENTYSTTGKTVPCAGFKKGDWYRLGVQFQHKTGKWSEPIYLKDMQMERRMEEEEDTSNNNIFMKIPVFQGTIPQKLCSLLHDAGYRKARGVIVYPEIQDRVVLCQGVANPTVYTKKSRNTNKNVYAQSSWFFRPYHSSEGEDGTEIPTSGQDVVLPYAYASEDGKYNYNPTYIRRNEIQGDFDENERFMVDAKTLTLHSPDIEFDDNLAVMDYGNLLFRKVGWATFTYTMSDIDIQTESPTISNGGSGVIRKSFKKAGPQGIIAGLFYDDYLVDEWSDESFHQLTEMHAAAKWMVYPWHASGSLNNDINRPADKGTPSAKLKKKVISNLRYTDSSWLSDPVSVEQKSRSQLYRSEETAIVKLGENIYQGNVDTMLTPSFADGSYLAMNSLESTIPGEFNDHVIIKTFSENDTHPENNGLWVWIKPENLEGLWFKWEGRLGDKYIDLVIKRNPVRMKYKSSPHIVFDSKASILPTASDRKDNSLYIVEMYRNINTATLFGGTSEDALRENTWLPCGEPVTLNTETDTIYYYSYGDTYFQRWDCLKTYPFTREDPNQIVEIGSFMLETRINIDGRYDRNRGQLSNLNMSPQNFNLLNMVYSQKDNFFSYKIVSEDERESRNYPNQITWSKTKDSGAEVDLWTNVTMASVLELDGDKGGIRSLQRLNDQLIAFQDNGVAQILYNENTQISTSEGVPIEIANSGKVQGKRYISDTIGCSNKWSIANTSMGIYFMDSFSKGIFMYNGQLQNLSLAGGFNAWSKDNIPNATVEWYPGTNNTAFASFYDRQNQEVLFVNKDTCLAYSERVGAFTSFYSYEDTPFFCNLGDTGVWVRTDASLWQHQKGEYGDFFGNKEGYEMTLIGNPEPQLDKIFTNIEFRACVEGDGEPSRDASKFTPTLPFDSLETWDEYQHGITSLENKNGHAAMVHGGNSSALKRKFRIWRCDIPRDNTPKTADQADNQGYTLDTTLGISRYYRKPMDRMRNPWLYLKLEKACGANETLAKTEIHDIVMTYYS